MARILNLFAKPWDSPQWFFLALVGLNRLIMSYAVGSNSQEKLISPNILMHSVQFIFGSFLLAVIMSTGMLITARLLRMAATSDMLLNDFIPMALKAQSGFLLAAPLSLLILTIHKISDMGSLKVWGGLLEILFVISIPPMLFLAIRRKFSNLNESSAILLALSPYLILFGFLALGLIALFVLVASILTMIFAA